MNPFEQKCTFASLLDSSKVNKKGPQKGRYSINRIVSADRRAVFAKLLLGGVEVDGATVDGAVLLARVVVAMGNCRLLHCGCTPFTTAFELLELFQVDVPRFE